MRKTIVFLFPLVFLAIPAFLGWWMLVPRADPRPLPPDLISAGSPEGAALLGGADAMADYDDLGRHFVTQSLKSYCGVASGVAVLSALGIETSQRNFFAGSAGQVRPRWRVMLTGMPLDDLGGLLAAHGAQVAIHHADSLDLGTFRKLVSGNLARDGDYLIVNYQREGLGQEPTGHISPLAAYDAETDRVLIMDTASYKYPYTWAPVGRLFAAMNTIDSETGETRGLIEVSTAASQP